MDNKIAHNNTVQWIQSALNRFENMYYAGHDLNGKPAIDKAVSHLFEHGKLTVGQAQYLFDRTHALGAQPKYNKHRGFHTKYGDMTTCNLQNLIDSDLVDWTTGKNGVMSPKFAQAISKETNHEWSRGNLQKKPAIMADLFEGLK
jgi:hypothetical protein